MTKHHDTLRTMTKHHNTSWTMTRHHDTSRTTTWTMTNHDEPWRTMTKHHEPWWNITNHDEPPRNHHEPSRSLIQNEIWYWILDSDWLNSGSHDIFLRILEKNYPEQSRTTTKHHEPLREPWRTMTNHDEPWRNITNHDKPPRTTTKPPRTITKSHSKWDLILNLGLWLVK